MLGILLFMRNERRFVPYKWYSRSLKDDMEEWHPLQDIWAAYNKSLEMAIAEGHIYDADLSDQYIWPGDLSFADLEQDDVKQYVHERMQEIFERIQVDRGLDPNVLANVIFRSILCGMMWQKERNGKW